MGTADLVWIYLRPHAHISLVGNVTEAEGAFIGEHNVSKELGILIISLEHC